MAAQKTGLRARPYCPGTTNENGLRCSRRGALCFGSYSRKARFSDWQDGRRARHIDDTDLVAAIHEHVAVLPTYGYRRVWALLRRSQEMAGAPCVNVKRVYRVMRDHQLLLRRPGQRRDTRRHDGQISVDQSDVRWCSDGFEFRCDDGSPLRVTFALICMDPVK